MSRWLLVTLFGVILLQPVWGETPAPAQIDRLLGKTPGGLEKRPGSSLDLLQKGQPQPPSDELAKDAVSSPIPVTFIIPHNTCSQGKALQEYKK